MPLCSCLSSLSLSLSQHVDVYLNLVTFGDYNGDLHTISLVCSHIHTSTHTLTFTRTHTHIHSHEQSDESKMKNLLQKGREVLSLSLFLSLSPIFSRSLSYLFLLSHAHIRILTRSHTHDVLFRNIDPLTTSHN